MKFFRRLFGRSERNLLEAQKEKLCKVALKLDRLTALADKGIEAIRMIPEDAEMCEECPFLHMKHELDKAEV